MVLIIGAAVTTGLEALAPVLEARRLILVDPRNGLYNSQDRARDPALYVACACDGGGDFFDAVIAYIPTGSPIAAISFVDCLCTDDQGRVKSECRDALRLAASSVPAVKCISFGGAAYDGACNV